MAARQTHIWITPHVHGVIQFLAVGFASGLASGLAGAWIAGAITSTDAPNLNRRIRAR